ncbi:MAG: hypothetical protein U5M23_10355 [Marinagarivorans sp.]|nr:hypothetical protein [Marinagarivorans sp.]
MSIIKFLAGIFSGKRKDEEVSSPPDVVVEMDKMEAENEMPALVSSDEIKNTFLAVIELEKNINSEDVIAECPGAYIIHDDFIDQLWRTFSERYGFDLVEESVDGDSHCILYKGEKTLYAVKNDRDDSIRAMLALYQAIKNDFTLFYCIDSWHNGDLVYIAVPNSILSEIKKLVSDEKINYRFIELNLSFDDFMELAFSEQNNRQYD